MNILFKKKKTFLLRRDEKTLDQSKEKLLASFADKFIFLCFTEY